MTGVLFAAVAVVVFTEASPAEETSVHFTVRPMLAPRPALKYQLLPELRELNSGNAAQNYLKCFCEQRNFFYSKEAVADRARYQTMPLAELPLDKLRDYGGSALRQADWAARQDSVDWQDLQRVQAGGLEELPPGVGPLQILAAALQVRFRAEVAGRRFDDAVRTAKTMFALARHLGEHPSEVANLVGLWVAHLSLDTLEEMVQQPGCPNLYWALTDLPCPLVDLRKGVQGERALVAADLRVLRDDAPMAEADLEKFVGHFCGVMSFAREQAGRSPRSLRPALQARVKDEAGVRAARRRLIEAGAAQALVNRFSPLQVILLDHKRDYEIERDERLKLLGLPLWQIDALAGTPSPLPLFPAAVERGAKSSPHPAGERGRGEGLDCGGNGLFADLLPDIIQLRRTQGQLEQQIALLRHVEALRLYASEHDGKLPAQLSDLTVPLPADPVTGRSFGYAVEGPTARLRGSALSNGNRDSGHKVRYDVLVQK